MAKKYEELTFNDDFMFCRILEEKPALCRELLELVLDHKVGELVSVNPQKPIEITANGKGVRFDVYAEGSDSEIYDIEMQNASVDSIAKRSRYSQGMIDLNLIKRGSHYSELNRSYVIYICRFNFFKEGELHKYSFRNLCIEDPQIELGDETEKIFLCAEGTSDDVSEKMQAFLRYIASGTPSDSFTNELENEVKKARGHIQWRTEYMTFLEQLEKEREAGRAEGRDEERVNTEREKARADAAENRADAAENRAEAAKNRADAAENRAEAAENRADAEKSRADVAESRADGLAKEILELKKKLESLESRLSTSSSS